MKKALLFTYTFLILSFWANAQTSDEGPKYGISFSGFIKNDVFYDTRQTSAANAPREGHFFLLPDNVLLDINSKDLNANPSFHMLNIQTRLKADINGPDAFGAKTSGVIEMEFFGTSDADINGMRLRHSFVKLDWAKTTLLVGQYWNPMFPAESFPGTISFNTGVPFTPFSRNPQIKITQKFSTLSISLTAYSQRDFTSPGPDGNSNKYLRNAGLPDINLQIKSPIGKVFTAWIGADFKTILPELKTTANIETNVTLKSLSTYATANIKTQAFTLTAMAIYGQNATDLMMMGGYAVSEITDSVTMFKKYTNLNCASFWADLSSTGKKFKVGVFSGYSRNLGAKDLISGPIYARAGNVDHLFRISPRLILINGNLSFAFEIENTVAAYGNIGSYGKVTDTKNVSNTRFLLSTIYKF